MPIYMDRHDSLEVVSAEYVAELHREDLKVQQEYNCRIMTYWFDAKRNTAFCLVEAPDINAIQDMHNQAHGGVPHKIIEVDASIVESFLGRIADPEKSQKKELNIINDPAFRTIMVVKIRCVSLVGALDKKLDFAINKEIDRIVDTISGFKGRIIKQKVDYFLISFDSVTNAVLCAFEIQAIAAKVINGKRSSPADLCIGLSAGIPVSEKEGLFEDTIQLAERLCDAAKGQVAVSSEVRDLYESENLNASIDVKFVQLLSSNDEIFLNLLMDFTEREWCNTTFNMDGFSKSLGFSKSQLYRKIVTMTGKSPNAFIRDYRLRKALKLLNEKRNNISEVAYETGFNAPAYFSKCFKNAYGILPSEYLKY